ncbi:MAG: hypothetical protein ACSLFD_11865 [Solirubrobacterales bacterium]
MAADSGQASVEALAGIAVLLLTAAVCFQLLATGYTATLADGAAEAGAVALVQGKPVEAAVRRALPGWARSRYSLSRSFGRVEVRLRPPAVVSDLGDRLELTSSATAETP